MKNRQRYTVEEILQLSKLLKEGKSVKQISTILNRSYYKLYAKIRELGLKNLKSKIIVKKHKRRVIIEVVKDSRKQKIEYYNQKIKEYFKGSLK